MQDSEFMQVAIEQAKQAYQFGEVPVGAVLVLNDEIISKSYNQTISLSDPSAHAECLAIRAAAKKIRNHRLVGATLYVTLEPCSMCAGLLVHARISRLVFGAMDAKTGSCGSIYNIIQDSRLNHQVDVVRGVLEEQCADLLSEFFRFRRQKKKALRDKAKGNF